MNRLKIAVVILCFSLENTHAQDKKIKLMTDTVSNSKMEGSRPKNIIFMIGDGMGATQLYAGMLKNGNHLNIERIKHIGLHKNNSADQLITDSAAGATAFSIGEKTYNYAIGVDKDSIPKETIMETAKNEGLGTGIVVTCTITHATPASFYAHQPKRSDIEPIALDFLKQTVDIGIGGGENYFEKRSDGRNLSAELRQKGYTVLDTSMDFRTFEGKKLLAFTAAKEPKKISEGRGETLLDGTKKAIEILGRDYADKGFFLLVEGSQIDWGGHNNDLDYIMNEVIDFDKAIGAALDFADKDGNTLVIITADHETGGTSITAGSVERKDPRGSFTTKLHTATLIPVYAYGKGAQKFNGIYENTEIYHKMMDALKLKKIK